LFYDTYHILRNFLWLILFTSSIRRARKTTLSHISCIYVVIINFNVLVIEDILFWTFKWLIFWRFLYWTLKWLILRNLFEIIIVYVIFKWSYMIWWYFYGRVHSIWWSSLVGLWSKATRKYLSLGPAAVFCFRQKDIRNQWLLLLLSSTGGSKLRVVCQILFSVWFLDFCVIITLLNLCFLFFFFCDF